MVLLIVPTKYVSEKSALAVAKYLSWWLMEGAYWISGETSIVIVKRRYVLFFKLIPRSIITSSFGG
jgi:hypothetical protein